MDFLGNHDFWLFLLAVHNLLSWLIRIAMMVIVPMRHTPSTAMAWLVVILFWPMPCLLVYLILGSNLLPQKRLKRHRELLFELKEVRDKCKRALCGATPRLPKSLKKVSSLAETLGHMAIIGSNDCQLITEASFLSKSLVKDIDRSNHNVDLLYYIFAADNIGKPVIKALKRAVKRGVSCRVMLDAVGSAHFFKNGNADILKKYGIQVVEALPASIFRRHAARFDLRNHRKLAIIDGDIAYTGSHNIINPNYGHKDLVWKDMSIKLTGPVVRQLQAVFFEDWYVETGEKPDLQAMTLPVTRTGDIAIQTVPSGPSYKTENYQRLIVSALHDAVERVVITTPYLIPDESLLQALEVAALRGVKVDLIIPSRSDQFMVGHAAQSYYEELMELGVGIYLFQQGLLHAKTMTVDGKLSFFGSSNFDIRSFALNFEINLIFYGVEETSVLLKKQEEFMSNSKKLSIELWKQRPLYQQAFESITKLFSPLL